ncbi:unnamed protein product [Nezara viridula]|uniref:Mitochondrial thiamine pyrophosphate carrier n=1 Tax=Nezara viridula TaxID=85310 RepID=A0A9P0MMZ1_NEZVI|nr:unnamed protein product [Nezara viridula]
MPGYDKEKPNLSPHQYAIAGAGAGAVTRFLCQPFDVLKIRFQLQVEPISKNILESKYQALQQATRTILAEEGLLGLWKGHNPGQLLSISYGLIQFQAFEYLTRASEKYLNMNAKSPGVHFICGSIAGAASTVGSFPFDVVRTRFIAQGNEKMYLSMYHAFKVMLIKEGPVAYFRGLTPSLLLVAPQAGATFTSHNILVSLFVNFKLIGPDRKPSIVQNLIIGSLAGTIAKTLVYPLDLSRKRLQIQGFQEGRKGFGKNFYCRGMINSIYLTVKNEGFAALYKGLAPSILKAAITTALHFTTYDVVCQFFTVLNSSR